jgi:hypothetical protein
MCLVVFPADLLLSHSALSTRIPPCTRKRLRRRRHTRPAKKRRSRPNRTQKAADGVSSKVSNQLIEVGFVFEPHSSKHRRDLRFSAVIVLGVNFGVVFAGRPLAVDLGMRFLRYRSLRDVLSCCV